MLLISTGYPTRLPRLNRLISSLRLCAPTFGARDPLLENNTLESVFLPKAVEFNPFGLEERVTMFIFYGRVMGDAPLSREPPLDGLPIGRLRCCAAAVRRACNTNGPGGVYAGFSLGNSYMVRN